MFWIFFAAFCQFSVVVGVRFVKEDVRICFGMSGCEEHSLICEPAQHIIIEEAFMGYNCTAAMAGVAGCMGCCSKETDFKCWDGFDVVPVRNLCGMCWRQSRCSVATPITPNRCSTGRTRQPVYSIIKYSCKSEKGDTEERGEDLCSDYLIELRPILHIHPDHPVEPVKPEQKKKGGMKRGIVVGCVFTVFILLIAAVIVTTALYLNKRRKKPKESVRTVSSPETSMESLPEYHVLESCPKGNSQRNSTYYNTIDDVLKGQPSVKGRHSSSSGIDNRHSRNIDSYDPRKENIYYNNFGKTPVSKLGNPRTDALNITDAEREYDYLGQKFDKRKLTRKLTEEGDTYQHLYELDDDGFSHHVYAESKNKRPISVVGEYDKLDDRRRY